MDGLSYKGTALFLGKLPNRKSLCFYFSKGNVIYPVAYVRKGFEGMAIERWRELIGDKDEL
jgi:hypothetical protein